jgi:hypothetical protein
MARTKADPTRRTLVDIKNGVDKTGGASKAGGEKKKYRFKPGTVALREIRA